MSHTGTRTTKDHSLNVYKNFDPQFNGSKLGRDFASKAKNKKEQLDSSSADMKILLCVVNSQPMIALNTKEEWDGHARLLCENLSWGSGYYVGILTGVKPNGVSSDTIFSKTMNEFSEDKLIEQTAIKIFGELWGTDNFANAFSGETDAEFGRENPG